jgi:hypothetical protein
MNPTEDRAFFGLDYALTTAGEVTSSAFVTITPTTQPSEAWFANSGATRHMSGHLDWFTTLQHIPVGQWPIRGISSQIIYARGIGRIYIDCFIDGQWRTGHLDNVLYIPGLSSNPFSLSRVAMKGIDNICSRNRCYLTSGDNILMEGILDNMLYRLLIHVKPPDTCLYAANLGTSSQSDERQSLQTWHNQLSHVSHDSICKMAKAVLVDGLQITHTDDDTFCEGCTKGKQHRNTFPTNNPRVRASVPGKIIHVDICGLMSVRSLGGVYYFAAFKDDSTCYRIVHCLVYKLDV